jgi:hypothetical protein
VGVWLLSTRPDAVPPAALPVAVVLPPVVVAPTPTPTPPSTEAERTADVEPAAPSPAVAAAEPTLPTKVKVQVSTVPSGAEVKLNQRVVGHSPVEVELARDTKPIHLSVLHAGRAPVEQSLIPDRDQRLLLQLPIQRHRGHEKDPLDQKW